MAEPVMHYFLRNTIQTVELDYAGAVKNEMTLTLCKRLLHGYNARTATTKKDEVTCKKCLNKM